MEPLRGSNAPSATADMHDILARSEPSRIKHGRISIRVEEFLVRWGPQICTFGETLEQYRLGFNVSSIISMEENIPSHALAIFVSTKRLTRAQRRALQRPPLNTRCVVQYDPSSQGPCHNRSIKGGAHALDFFSSQ